MRSGSWHCAAGLESGGQQTNSSSTWRDQLQAVPKSSVKLMSPAKSDAPCPMPHASLPFLSKRQLLAIHRDRLREEECFSRDIALKMICPVLLKGSIHTAAMMPVTVIKENKFEQT